LLIFYDSLLTENLLFFMQDTAMDITQVLLAAQSPDANFQIVAESNLTQFQEQKL
jgi:hypothetical protein